MKVKVIDDIMGSSKTSAMIEYMNKNTATEKFVFVTPFLSEVSRIKDSCFSFMEPEKNGHGSKLESFKSLLLNSNNVVTTHSLFKSLDQECMH